MDGFPTHGVILRFVTGISAFLSKMGVSNYPILEELIYVVIIILLSLALGWVVRLVVLFFIKRVIRLRKFEIGQELIKQKIFSKVSNIVPPAVLLGLISFAFVSNDSFILRAFIVLIKISLSLTIGVAISAILNFMWNSYDNRRNDKNHPLRGVLIVAQGLVWIVIAIITVSNLLGKSPTVLLTGLGAFAAALMLIFKDSILGFVAGVQLSQNDMLRVGDWIIVPSTIANGIVEDVSLTVVKIRNWDNTLVMLPPYTLVSTSFQNWRGMVESNVWLISQNVIIDVRSVVNSSEALENEILEKHSQLKEFIENNSRYQGGIVGVNGTNETNLGLYRAYLCTYLITHPMVSIHHQMFVTLLDSTPKGQPLQIYCYAATTDWAIYEAVKSEIMEHAIAIAPQFKLLIYSEML
jgi:miniconductance mechanosensitive channel